MVTLIQNNAGVSYSLHVLLMHFTYEFWDYLFNHGLTFAALFPLSTVDVAQKKPEQVFYAFSEYKVTGIDLSEILSDTMEMSARIVKLKSLYHEVNIATHSLNGDAHPTSSEILYRTTCKCHTVVMGNCNDILEETDMSGLKQVAPIYPCNRCLVPKHETPALKLGAFWVHHKIDGVLKSKNRNYSEYNLFITNDKTGEAWANLIN